MAVRIEIGARRVEVEERELSIGREGADIVIDDDEVSRRHASIRALAAGGARVTDLDSRNGTFVDGERIEGTRRITGGETIRIGQTEIATEPVSPALAETKVPLPPAHAHMARTTTPPPTPGLSTSAQEQTPAGQMRESPAPWLWLGFATLLVLIAVPAYFLLIRGSAEDQIEEAAHGAFVSTDVGYCDYFTEGFYEAAAEVTGQTAEEAKQGCRESDLSTGSDSVTVTDLEIDGDMAIGTVNATQADGVQSVEVTFADEDGWKIDSTELPE